MNFLPFSDPRFLSTVLIDQALTCDDGLAKQVLHRVAEDYAKKANAKERGAGRLEVASLPSAASEHKVIAARRQGAVQWGGQTYGPIVPQGHMLLPSVLLRSSLFSSASDKEDLSDVALPIVRCRDGNLSLRASGSSLNSLDRRVFGACLAMYGDKSAAVPLDQSITVSLYELVIRSGVRPGRNAYAALEASLERLANVQFALALEGRELPVKRLIAAQVDRTTAGGATVTLRIEGDLAVLLARGLWISVPSRALVQFTGLAGWLVCFLRTQSGPYLLEHRYLRELSGYRGGITEFRRSLKKATKALSEPDVDEMLRLSRVYWSPQSVVFMMARYSENAAERPLRKALAMQRSTNR